MKIKPLRIGLLALLLALVIYSAPQNAGKVTADEVPQSIPGTPIELKYDPVFNPYKVAPPEGVIGEERQPLRAEAVPIVVNFNPATTCPGIHPNDPNPNNPTWLLNNWPANAQTAMNLAARIWSELLNGNRTVVVDACWYSTLGANVLGQASPTSFWQDFQDAPQKNTWYPVALANQIAESDLNAAAPEIRASFSAAFTWYLGTDGNIPVGQVDFLSTALHELGHGLGFSGSGNWDDGAGGVECNGTAKFGCVSAQPYIYDKFVRSGTSNIASFTNPSLALGNALIGNNLNFNGLIAVAANGNAAPRLFAPNPWSPGSSYSHLDEATFNNTPNALMTPTLANGESDHHPGPVAMGILADMGWSFNGFTYVAVDSSNNGSEDGTFEHPYNTVQEGAMVVRSGGLVYISAGSYNERLTIRRSMTLLATGGTVTIGK